MWDASKFGWPYVDAKGGLIRSVNMSYLFQESFKFLYFQKNLECFDDGCLQIQKYVYKFGNKYVAKISNYKIILVFQ